MIFGGGVGTEILLLVEILSTLLLYSQSSGTAAGLSTASSMELQSPLMMSSLSRFRNGCCTRTGIWLVASPSRTVNNKRQKTCTNALKQKHVDQRKNRLIDKQEGNISQHWSASARETYTIKCISNKLYYLFFPPWWQAGVPPPPFFQIFHMDTSLRSRWKQWVKR